MLGIASDYLPDHIVKLNELIFDIPTLGLSLILFTSSMLPILRSVVIELTDLDRLVINQLFEPVGVSDLQYKSMKSVGCVDWVEVPAGTVLATENCLGGAAKDDDYLYWLYEGNAIFSYNQTVSYQVERTEGRSIDCPSALGLLADMRFVYRWDMEKKNEKIFNPNPITPAPDQPYPMSTITVGLEGATLMRINSLKLFKLMRHDEHLSSSIRALLLKSLQRKVGNLVRSRGSEVNIDPHRHPVEEHY